MGQRKLVLQAGEERNLMVERIDDMPAGTIGFLASGKLTRDDYREVLPTSHALVAS
jgi:hypothetical protein